MEYRLSCEQLSHSTAGCLKVWNIWGLPPKPGTNGSLVAHLSKLSLPLTPHYIILTCSLSSSPFSTHPDSPTYFITRMPFLVAASRSTLSTPVPALPTTCNFSAALMTSAVTLVAERTMRPSQSWSRKRNIWVHLVNLEDQKNYKQYLLADTEYSKKRRLPRIPSKGTSNPSLPSFRYCEPDLWAPPTEMKWDQQLWLVPCPNHWLSPLLSDPELLKRANSTL